MIYSSSAFGSIATAVSGKFWETDFDFENPENLARLDDDTKYLRFGIASGERAADRISPSVAKEKTTYYNIVICIDKR